MWNRSRRVVAMLLTTSALVAVAPSAASAATCTVGADATWSTFDWGAACAELPAYEPLPGDDVEVAAGFTLTIDADVTVATISAGASAVIESQEDVTADEVQLASGASYEAVGVSTLGGLVLGSGSVATLNGDLNDELSVPSSGDVELNGALEVNTATIHGGGVVDLNGHGLDVVDGGVMLDGSFVGGAARIISTGARGSLAINGFGPSLSISRGELTNLGAAVGGLVSFDPPFDAAGEVVNTLTDATIEITAPSAALSANCGLVPCQPVTINGTGSSRIRLAGALETTLNAQLLLNLPIEVSAASPTWRVDPDYTVAAPDAPSPTTALVRLGSTPTRVGGGALAIGVNGPTDMADAGLDIAVGEGFTAIAAPSVASFSGANAATDRVFATDTSSTPQQLMVFRGPLPAITSTAAPVISGSGGIGAALTATTGSWSQSAGVTFAYQWFAKASGASSFSAIPGATAATYSPTIDKASAEIKVEVTARKIGYVSAAQSSNVIKVSGQITNITPPKLPAQIIDGTPVTVDVGTWSESTGVSYTYQWYRYVSVPEGSGTSTVAGGTSATLTPSLSSLNAPGGSRRPDGTPEGTLRLAVQVTASKAGYASKTVETAYVDVIAAEPRFQITAPADKVPVGVVSFLPFTSLPAGAAVVTQSHANAYDYRVDSCALTNGRATCDARGVRMLPYDAGEQTVTVTLAAKGGLTKTVSLKLQVRDATAADVVLDATSHSTRRGEVGQFRFSNSVAAGWMPDCTANATSVVAGSTVGYVTELSPWVGATCTHPERTTDPTMIERYGYSGITLYSVAAGPGTYAIDVPYSIDLNGRSVRVVVPYTLTVAKAEGQTVVRSESMGGAHDAAAELTCPGVPENGSSSITAIYSWSSNGKSIAFGSQYRRLPASLMPKNGTVSCIAIVNFAGKVGMFQAELIVENGVRVSGSVSTYRSAASGKAAKRAGAYAQFGLKLVASGSKTVRVTTYRRVSAKVRTKAGKVVTTMRYQAAGARLVKLQRGTRGIPITVRRATGYKIVVTAMRVPKSGPRGKLVPGSSMEFVLSGSGKVLAG